MAEQADNPLGQTTKYPTQFDAGLLFSIPRTQSRQALGIDDALPFTGYDRWTAYELSWLNPTGKPEMRVAEFIIAADSPCIIESKSFKLYLNSYNQTVFADEQAVITQLSQDLSAGFGLTVAVNLFDLNDTNSALNVTRIDAQCLDDLDIEVTHYQPDANILKTQAEIVNGKRLVSHLLKTNCPITDQPDWASVYIEYSGELIDPASLLKYIISFRQHQGYHENCVEQIFCDIKRHCQPEALTVYARYTRRGGLDINPLRSDIDEQSQLWGKVLRGLRQ